MIDPSTTPADEWDLFDRSVRHATATWCGAELDAALTDLGWADALAVDERAAVTTLFERQGEACSTSRALEGVLAAAHGGTYDSGAAVVLPPLGAWTPAATLDDHMLTIRGLCVGGGAGDLAVVALDGTNTMLLRVGVAGFAQRTVGGLDPGLRLVEIAGALPGVDAHVEQTVRWDDAVAAGQRALGHELVGASRAMLALARDHALERVQFGRPIAGFQAVRHRLAESLVAIEAASAALEAAWIDRSAMTAAIAKAVAGRGARTVARHAQQVLAGIGFTAEHPLHGYVRRVIVLDELLGNARSLTRDLGEQLLASRELPAILPL